MGDQLFIPSLYDDKNVTLTKSQKKFKAESTAGADREETLLWSTVTRTPEPGMIVAIVPPWMDDDYVSGFATAGVVFSANN